MNTERKGTGSILIRLDTQQFSDTLSGISMALVGRQIKKRYRFCHVLFCAITFNQTIGHHVHGTYMPLDSRLLKQGKSFFRIVFKDFINSGIIDRSKFILCLCRSQCHSFLKPLDAFSFSIPISSKTFHENNSTCHHRIHVTLFGQCFIC